MTPDMPPLPEAIAALSFEEAYERLKALTAELEADKLPLEESLRAFEEATHLHRRCQQLLQIAEDRIQLMQNGAWAPFAEGAEE